MKHSKHYHKKTKRALAALKTMTAEQNPNAVAKELGCWPQEIRRALSTGYVSPALVRAVIVPRKRVRFSADVSPELRAELRAEAEFWGGSNGELLEAMWMRWNYPLPDSHAPSGCDPTGRNIESEPGR